MDLAATSPSMALSMTLAQSPIGSFDYNPYSYFPNGGVDYEEYMPDDNAAYSTSANSDSSGQKISPTPPVNANASAGTRTQQSTMSQIQSLKEHGGRRSHPKSRRGCFNCKRRRIKCQETRPRCGHCVRTGLDCEYPALPQIVHQPHHQIPLFSLQDMRFFQHFLLNCYPHHPLGNESVWTHEIPCLSQNYEFLMHAILGLAASDLMASDPSLSQAAMAHRLKAIRAIKRALGNMPRTSTLDHGGSNDEANALVATCFALTFQSVVLEDGMAEYMTFIRGILIVSMQMWVRGACPMFTNMTGADSQEVLAPHMESLPLIPGEWADGALAAVEGLRGLCRHRVEVEYLDLLVDMCGMLHVSSFGAYKVLQKHYGWWMMLPHEKFQRIIDPANQTATLLATHWIALKQIMAFITEAEHRVRDRPRGGGAESGTDQGMIRWLRYLNAAVDWEHRAYNQWPVWVAEQLEGDISFFGKTR